MSSELIDTHAHLDDERFQRDLPQVLERAAAVGVRRIVTVATTAASSAVCVKQAEQYPCLSATVGIHPNHAAEAAITDWDQVRQLAQRPQVVAVGETGLDRHWDFTPFALQEEYFARHLELSRRQRLPIVIHCREADADVLRMLREDYARHGPLRGVMHSFTGDKVLAEACLNIGLHISFAGMLTYKSARDLRVVAQGLPLDRLLVETDCPYLAPAPRRGQRNEPAFVRHTATCLAETLGLDFETVAIQTTRNARELFNINH
ncbi:MAG: TatD family hydrolase [Gemmataceae bacterium]